jgi:gamma-glutamyltranspeptidase/glutathione hydrolase
VDEQGNAVAVTTTLNDSFGSRVTATGLGFLLNDEMDDFAAKQGVPNAYGLIQGPANAIGPKKRPLSAMTPTIVLKDGKLFLVLGSPGGPRIITTVANILMGVVDYGMNIQEAVNAPRFHHQWLPDEIVVEDGFSPDTLRLLERMGHNLHRRDGYWSDGECIAIDPKTAARPSAIETVGSASPAYAPTTEPIFSPATTRPILPLRFKLKTMMGRLLSLQREMAVESITFKPSFRTSM